MKICERCGNEITENTAVCLVCGTVLGQPQATDTPTTGYGYPPQSSFGAPPSSQPPRQTPQYTQYTQPQTYQKVSREPAADPNAAYSYVEQPPLNRSYSAPPSVTSPDTHDKIDSAIITEILLSLFGIFGVGWLMAGETAVGVILLLGSIFIYWPIMLLGTIFTMGFGLICLGPLAVGTIILNILVLSNLLKRRATQHYRRPRQEQ